MDPEHRPVGLSWRPELATGALQHACSINVIEVLAERVYKHARLRREALALSEMWTAIPHGVSLSLGSADGVERERARALGKLAKELHAPFVTEHISFVRAAGVEIGHLTQLPRTRAAIDTLARNVQCVQRALPCPLVLENVAWSIRSRDDEMDEPTFIHEVIARTGCGLLLDVSNLAANARNEGKDPFAVLRAYPLEAVQLVHVAGARTGDDGFVYDTHADPISDEAFALAACAPSGAPVLIERDRNFPAFEEIVRDLARLRAGVDAASSTSMNGSHVWPGALARPPEATRASPRPPKRSNSGDKDSTAALASWQARTARALVGGNHQSAHHFDAAASSHLDVRELDRARSILLRKRAETSTGLH